MSFDFPLRSRPLCHKPKSTTGVVGSLLEGEANFCPGQLVVHYLPMSPVDVPKKLHHDCHEGCRAVSMGSQGMQSWHSTQGSDEGTEKLATHAKLASSRTPDPDIST